MRLGLRWPNTSAVTLPVLAERHPALSHISLDLAAQLQSQRYAERHALVALVVVGVPKNEVITGREERFVD